MAEQKNTMITTAVVDRLVHERLLRQLGPKQFSPWLRKKEAWAIGRNGKKGN